MQIQNNCFDEFIMVAPGSDYGVAMWSDIKKIENAKFLDYVIESTNKAIQLLHHIHFSFYINSRIQLPFQSLWRKYYSLEKYGIDSRKRVCLLFTDISACRTDLSYLKRLHRCENITMVMVLVNVMHSKSKLLQKRLEFFDQIYSFDKVDCEKYNFLYHPTLYSKTTVSNDTLSISSDAFFVGVSKGNRYDILKVLFEKINDKGGKADFYINGIKDDVHHIDGIHYNEWLDYSTVLKNVVGTNCIIEIMGEGQSGLTLRAMEAIVYNKKLLTNNNSVKELSYYKSGYIQWFNDIKNVDIDFILDKEPVDYHYIGDFSPILFLERISENYQANIIRKE